jgi:hypothetical protein
MIMTIRKSWIAVLALPLLILDGAALHDILHREPDVRLEWVFLGISVIIFGVLGRQIRHTRPGMNRGS